MAEIRVQFRHVPGNLYRNKLGIDLDRATNELVRPSSLHVPSLSPRVFVYVLFCGVYLHMCVCAHCCAVLCCLTPFPQVIRIQPNEAIYLKVNNKVPGLGLRLDVTKLDLSYKCVLRNSVIRL